MLSSKDFNDLIRQISKEELSKKDGIFKIGRVASVVNEKPSIIFEGESKASLKRYEHLSSYKPNSGDRVFLMKVKGSYLLIGKIGKFNLSAGTTGTGDDILVDFLWDRDRLGVKKSSEVNFTFSDSLKGVKGDKGDKGEQGDQGSTGLRGPQGIQGEPGVKGDKGDQGLQGPIGLTGPQGIQGLVGATGPQGERGLEGPQGLKGDTGAIGPQGLTGDQGDTGPEGPQGLTGPQGIKGDTGEQGLQGLKGDRGFVGPIGPRGEAGPQGVQGDTGLTGATGATGSQGPKGDKGDQGDIGPTGESGITTPIEGLFYLSGDADGNLYSYYTDVNNPPTFEVETNGDIYYVIPE